MRDAPEPKPKIVVDLTGIPEVPPFRERMPDESWVEYDRAKALAGVEHYRTWLKKLGRIPEDAT